MGLRDRIKGRLKAALGKQGDSGATSPAGAMPSTAATPTAASPRPAPPPPRPAPPPPSPKAEAAPSAPSDEEAEKKEKIRKHRLKTKAGMLKWLAQQEGGQSSLADMHDHSERRFFIAHRAFSDLMEELTGEGLVDYDGSSGTVTLTASGRAWKA